MMKRLVIIMLGVALLAIPTIVSADDVFVTENGKKYHKEDCRFLKESQTINLEENEAVVQGLKPCGICLKGKALSDQSAKADQKLSKADKKSKTK